MYLGGQVEFGMCASGSRRLPGAHGCATTSIRDSGYAMVALLIALSVMAVLMTVAMPVWKTTVQREKEEELIFRGLQYARAIELYQRKLPGAAPPNLEVLIDQKFLRKKYKDPITNDDFELLSPISSGLSGAPQQVGGRGGPPSGRGPDPSGRGGPPTGRGAPTQTPPGGPPASAGRAGGPGVVGAQAGIVGVVSKSKALSLRLYNGRNHYNEWQFVQVPRAAPPGAANAPGAGGPGQRGGPPGAGGPGQRGGPGQFPPTGPTGRGGRGDGRGGAPPMFPQNPPGGRGPGPGR